jgi:hypothetical protein
VLDIIAVEQLGQRMGLTQLYTQVCLQDLPKSEEAARAAVPRLSSLLAAAKAYQLVAVAENQAEGASGQEEARKGLGGIKLATGAHQQQAGQVRRWLGGSETPLFSLLSCSLGVPPVSG